MAERKPEWPEAGDLIIANVETVADYAAYAKRDLRHISQMSSSWTRIIVNNTKAVGQGTFRREK